MGITNRRFLIKTKEKLNLVGKKFYRLTVLSLAEKDNCGRERWNCLCDCGLTRLVTTYNLIKGFSKSCGCICRENLIGKKFGRLIVISGPHRISKHKVVWGCLCECSKIIKISRAALNNGNTKSCGCTPCQDLTGLKFGKLTVLKKIDEKDKRNNCSWLCSCDCGKTKVTGTYLLTSGGVASCGCAKYLYQDREEACRRDLYKNYKGGSKERNHTFNLSFLEFSELIQKNCAYCGIEPSKTFKIIKYNGIDRIDNNKGYSVENCAPCCHTCNFAKTNKTVEEFKKWAIQLGNNLSKIKDKLVP